MAVQVDPRASESSSPTTTSDAESSGHQRPSKLGGAVGYSAQALMLKPADPGVQREHDGGVDTYLDAPAPQSGGRGAPADQVSVAPGSMVQRKPSPLLQLRGAPDASKVDTADDKADSEYESPEGSLWAQDDAGNDLPPSLEDISQGGLNNCYLLSVLAALVNADPSKITGMITDHGNGTYTVSFRNLGSQNVTARFERGKHANVMARRALWPLIIEKAYAQAHGGLETFDEGGNPGSAAEELIGGGTSRITPADKTDDEVITTAKQGLDSQAVVTAATPKSEDASQAQRDRADETSVVFWHGYTVIEVDERGKRLKLFNPHGRNHPNGTGWIAVADFKLLYIELAVSGGQGSGGGSWV